MNRDYYGRIKQGEICLVAERPKQKSSSKKLKKKKRFNRHLCFLRTRTELDMIDL
jgi:hypothetical protein